MKTTKDSLRVLILSVDAGAGHIRAAEAITAWAHILRPSWHTKHVNVSSYTHSHFA